MTLNSSREKHGLNRFQFENWGRDYHLRLYGCASRCLLEWYNLEKEKRKKLIFEHYEPSSDVKKKGNCVLRTLWEGHIGHEHCGCYQKGNTDFIFPKMNFPIVTYMCIYNFVILLFCSYFCKPCCIIASTVWSSESGERCIFRCERFEK